MIISETKKKLMQDLTEHDKVINILKQSNHELNNKIKLSEKKFEEIKQKIKDKKDENEEDKLQLKIKELEKEIKANNNETERYKKLIEKLKIQIEFKEGINRASNFQKLLKQENLKNIELKAFGIEEYDIDKTLTYLLDLTEKLLKKVKIIDTSNYLYEAIKQGKKILFEGAQGAMLSIDFGTYPYVTSSSTLSSAIPINAGIPAEMIKNDYIVGILKAYTTRVGEGPFPSEILDERVNLIREKGHEFGTVTGRPRRIGWLDLAQVNFVVKISGVKHFALMLTDVLSVVDEINICTGYEIDGKVIDYYPANLSELYKVKPVFVTMKNWKEDISKIKKFEDLPKECQDYIFTIEKLTGGKVSLVSVGPDKTETIVREDLF